VVAEVVLVVQDQFMAAVELELVVLEKLILLRPLLQLVL